MEVSTPARLSIQVLDHQIIALGHNQMVTEFHRVLGSRCLVGQEMTDDQVEDVLSKGANVSIFGRHLAECQAAKEALRDIEERHNDLLLLEHGIRELNQLFQELGLHIELQVRW